MTLLRGYDAGVRVVLDPSLDRALIQISDRPAKDTRRRAVGRGVVAQLDETGEVVAVEIAGLSERSSMPTAVSVVFSDLGDEASLARLLAKVEQAVGRSGRRRRQPTPPGHSRRTAGITLRAGALREARHAAGLSLAQLGAGLVSRAAVQQYESGRARPSMVVLEELAQRTGRPIEFFREGG